jgi:PAS domain S-box-containing protein
MLWTVFVVLIQSALIVGWLAQRLWRRRAELSFRESEKRFRAMADAAPVLMWMAGPDKLCTFVNPTWLEFSGRTSEQEFGNGWAVGLHPDDSCLKTYASAFDTRKPFLLEYRLRRRDGEYRWLTDHGVPRYDAAGSFLGYIGACVDTTELREKEEAIREFEQRVTLAADAAHLGVWERDLANNNFWLSDKARELFQFDPSEPVTYRQFRERAYPEDLAASDLARDRAIETKSGYEHEYRALLPDGTVRWIAGRARCLLDENGNVARLLGVSMDVTERKEAQELFQLATEASPSGNLLINDQGRIVLVNAHIEELFGYEREELIGKPVEVLVPERFATELVARRAEFLAAPKVRPADVIGEVSARRKDGTEFPVEVGLNPIQTPHGTLVLATVVDISARKLAEAEAIQRREEVGHLGRVAVMGELTASLAHELNQPLAGIISNASAGERFIDRGNVDLRELRELLADIVADGRRAGEVIRGIRNMVKKGARVRHPLNLNDLVTNVVRMVKPDAMLRSCDVDTLLEPDLPSIEGDPIQLQQVLLNLLINAFDAMHDTPLSRRKVVIVTERNGDSAIRTSVRDYGVGISEEARDRLFDHFFTTKAQGLGMGLAIVRSIVESHSGTIASENVEGGGARFYFTLPVSPERAAHSAI